MSNVETTTSIGACLPAGQTRQVAREVDGRWKAHAPAKLNLGLKVFPRRADGFHDIDSWFVPISWHDTLWFEPGRDLEIVVTGRTEGIPTDPARNLIGRAAMKLAAAGGIQPRVRIELHKVLPAGGGLGGGSSDAASTLVALNEAWGLYFEQSRLIDIGAQVGSDVPFFVQGRAAVCRGRGERITPQPAYNTLFAVLIAPVEGLSTKAVFEAFDVGAGFGNLPEIDWRRAARATASELGELLRNDLEPAAFAIAPWLKQLRDQAATIVRQSVHMTGSGSTLFTLCPSGRAATEIYERLTAEIGGNTMCVPVRILR